MDLNKYSNIAEKKADNNMIKEESEGSSDSSNSISDSTDENGQKPIPKAKPKYTKKPSADWHEIRPANRDENARVITARKPSAFSLILPYQNLDLLENIAEKP